ncbi:MAG: AAA family ATPase [Deltaproteobacteria bacterium]|jgi:general secretion pathway protein A
MYLSHYNLAEKPFQITADPRFLWLGEKHQEALATLKYGVLDNRGFLLLTGDVGTGKTTLINALLRNLDKDIVVATVVDPNLEKLEFLNFLANAFNINEKFHTKVDFLIHFTRFLRNAYSDNKKVLLIIDEAQRLSKELLEEIRLLSNIEKDHTKLLSIFFVGQNEFNDTLMEKEVRALRQRITIRYHIEPLTADETREYIKCRLKVAGSEREIFDSKAIGKIYTCSRGYPRLINVICDNALLTGYVKDVKTINRAIIKECARELSVLDGTAGGHPRDIMLTQTQSTKPIRRTAVYASTLLLILFFGYLLILARFNGKENPLKHYYGQVLSGLQTSMSNQHAEKIGVHKPQEDASSHSVPEPEAHHGTVPSQAKDVDPQEHHASAHSAEAYKTSVDNPEAQQIDRGVPQKHDARVPSLDLGLLLSADDKLIIPFDYNTNELPENAYSMLDRIARVMLQNPEIDLVVQGYTDTLGAYHYNKKLSELRANTVQSYLVAKGVSPKKIRTIGVGEESPMASNVTEAGRRANRRVEIQLRPLDHE